MYDFSFPIFLHFSSSGIRQRGVLNNGALYYCFWYCRLSRCRYEDLTTISNTIYMKELSIYRNSFCFSNEGQICKLVGLVLPRKQSLCVCKSDHTHPTHEGGGLGHSLSSNPLGTLVSLWPIPWVWLRVGYTALTNRPLRWWKFFSSSPNSIGHMSGFRAGRDLAMVALLSSKHVKGKGQEA